MILRTLAAVLLFLAIQSVLAEEPKQENKAPLFEITCENKSDPTPFARMLLIDGELLVLSEVLPTPDPEAKTYEGCTRVFELRDTPTGQLIVLRPALRGQGHQPTKNLEVDGYFVTADYSCVPPSIKLTKEIEKYSYWKVPFNAKGPIVNKSDFKRPAYLSLGPEIIKVNHPNNDSHWEFLKVNLSLEPKDQFKAEEIELPK
jgi:hypothetical protein